MLNKTDFKYSVEEIKSKYKTLKNAREAFNLEAKRWIELVNKLNSSTYERLEENLPKKPVKREESKPRKTAKTEKPNLNQVREEIRRIAIEYEYDEAVLYAFAEYINGGTFKEAEPSMNELKEAVIHSFGYKTYQELKKDSNFNLFIVDKNLKMNNKEAWLKVYRRFVGIPEHEKNSIGETSINGVDVLRNFLPWKVFNLDPKIATASDIKSSFNELAKIHHPDHGGNPEVFQQLKLMRDSILAAY